MNSYVTSIRATDGSIIKFESHSAMRSTVGLAKQYASTYAYPDRYVVFTDERLKPQKDGIKKKKGEAVTERGIYMSLILRPSIFPSQASLLSSLAAAAVASVLSEHTSKDIGIGWVSNIYCDGRLIGNIGIEGKLDNYTSYEYLIITFELMLSERDFPPRLRDIVKQVFEKDNSSVPMIIAKDILNKFFAFYQHRKTPSKFMDVYRQKFILRGQRIKYIDDGKKKTAKVLGVDAENCSLKIESEEGKLALITTPSKVIIPKRIRKYTMIE